MTKKTNITMKALVIKIMRVRLLIISKQGKNQLPEYKGMPAHTMYDSCHMVIQALERVRSKSGVNKVLLRYAEFILYVIPANKNSWIVALKRYLDGIIPARKKEKEKYKQLEIKF